MPPINGDADYSWPACTFKQQSWQQISRGGTKADRTLSEIVVTIPPFIADLDVPLTASLVTQTDGALREIAALDANDGQNLASLGLLLLRTESVASSKIELVVANIQDFARALHGDKSNESAVSMVSATGALTSMIDDASGTQTIKLTSILKAHKTLMQFESSEKYYAGKLRDVQNWVGGSNYSPRNALFIPPPPQEVPELMNDLIKFCNRTDIPALVQATIAHAQFETIHPFTDGNGRIGRALINAVLRRRGVTKHVVLPLATALVAQRQSYFDLLNEYRRGNIASLLAAFAHSALIAAQQSYATARNLEFIFSQWRKLEANFRKDSATYRLFVRISEMPIFSVDDAVAALKVAPSSAYVAIENLHRLGVIEPLTSRKRNQIWGATAILDEIEDLSTRTAIAMNR